MDHIVAVFFWQGLVRYSVEVYIFQSRTPLIPLYALVPINLFVLLFICRRSLPAYRQIKLWVSNTRRLLTLHHRVLVHSLRRRGHRPINLQSTTTSSTHSFPFFFQLPGELRNLIYHFALVANGSIDALLYTDGSPGQTHVALGLLHASRRFRAEASPILYRGAHFNTTASHPFTRFLNDEWVSEITSLTLRADLGFLMRYDSLEHVLATEIPRLRSLVRLTIRFETFAGEYGPLDVAASIVACVGKMQNLRFLELEGVQRAPETRVLADSIREELGDTILSWRGGDPDDWTVAMRGMAGPLRVVS